MVFDKGPEARLREIHPTGCLLFSTDPVAADAVGCDILNSTRGLHRLGPIIGSGLVALGGIPALYLVIGVLMMALAPLASLRRAAVSLPAPTRTPLNQNL